MTTSSDRTQPASGASRTDERQDTIHLDDRNDAHTAPAAQRRDIVLERARGGVSFWSVLSGVLVAFGAFVVISAIIGAILAAVGANAGGVQTGDMAEAGIAVAVGLVLAQFLAYLWGGYTAGRMARGSGLLNGFLVPIVALVFVVILGAILAAVTGTTPDTAAADVQTMQLPLPLSDMGQLATGTGIGLLVAMILGGLLGGWMGARWHTKLEDGESRHIRE